MQIKILNKLLDIVPLPELNFAQERAMISWRAKLFDVKDKLGYVYVFVSGIGFPIGYFTVYGKAASLNSYMVPEDTWYAPGSVMATAPDLDGTWGHNIEGVFFRLTNGTYFEVPTNGPMGYIYVDKPIALFNVPILNPK